MIELQKLNLPVGQSPEGRGWKMETGNLTHNLWWRVVRPDGDAQEVLSHTCHWAAA